MSIKHLYLFGYEDQYNVVLSSQSPQLETNVEEHAFEAQTKVMDAS